MHIYGLALLAATQRGEKKTQPASSSILLERRDSLFPCRSGRARGKGIKGEKKKEGQNGQKVKGAKEDRAGEMNKTNYDQRDHVPKYPALTFLKSKDSDTNASLDKRKLTINKVMESTVRTLCRGTKSSSNLFFYRIKSSEELSSPPTWRSFSRLPFKSDSFLSQAS